MPWLDPTSWSRTSGSLTLVEIRLLCAEGRGIAANVVAAIGEWQGISDEPSCAVN